MTHIDLSFPALQQRDKIAIVAVFEDEAHIGMVDTCTKEHNNVGMVHVSHDFDFITKAGHERFVMAMFLWR